MNARCLTLALAATVTLFATASLEASPINFAPPGGAFLDLNGLALPNGGNGMPGGGPGPSGSYTASFIATAATTTLTLAFRDDGAFIDLYDVVLVDNNFPSTNIINNPQFNESVYTQNGNSAVPIGWNYDNIYGAAFGGTDVTGGCSATNGGTTIGPCWHDGAVQAYDAISQSNLTTIGDQYTLYLLLAEDNNTNFAHNGTGNGFTDFSSVSTNGQPGPGGNGIDVLAYALPGENNIPSPVPEPATWALLGGGLAILGLFGRRH